MLIFGHALSAEMDIRSNTLDGGGYPGMRIRSITAICANLCSQPDTHKYGKQLSRRYGHQSGQEKEEYQ